MNIQRPREARHGYFRWPLPLLPLALLLGCNSAPTGTAPGLAGGQALTPGITNYPMAYVKQPVLMTNTNKKDKAATPNDIDVRDLITSITGSDLYVRDTASAASARGQRHLPDHQWKGRGARPRCLAGWQEGRSSRCACRSTNAQQR